MPIRIRIKDPAFMMARLLYQMPSLLLTPDVLDPDDWRRILAAIGLWMDDLDWMLGGSPEAAEDLPGVPVLGVSPDNPQSLEVMAELGIAPDPDGAWGKPGWPAVPDTRQYIDAVMEGTGAVWDMVRRVTPEGELAWAHDVLMQLSDWMIRKAGITAEEAGIRAGSPEIPLMRGIEFGVAPPIWPPSQVIGIGEYTNGPAFFSGQDAADRMREAAEAIAAIMRERGGITKDEVIAAYEAAFGTAIIAR